jgi:hypothetical protein
MQRYIFRLLAVCAGFLAAHFAVCMYVPALISSEYWVRELILVKAALQEKQLSPRILFLSGSSTLFGIDAKLVEEKLGVPAFNMGLHAGMRLDQILAVGEASARRGDLLVLALEPPYYNCNVEKWNEWSLRSVLTWDREYFNRLNAFDRAQAIFSGGNPWLGLEIVSDRIFEAVHPSSYVQRQTAMERADIIVARYYSGKAQTKEFAYSAYNVDARGDILNLDDKTYHGATASSALPDGICSPSRIQLAGFAQKMRAKGVRVVLAHPPYLVDTQPTSGWQKAEANFLRAAADAGLEVIDRREQLFFPRRYFFNSNLHLNREGRRIRTEIMVQSLKAYLVKHEGK